jgi:hypothetical protein
LIDISRRLEFEAGATMANDKYKRLLANACGFLAMDLISLSDWPGVYPSASYAAMRYICEEQ